MSLGVVVVVAVDEWRRVRWEEKKKDRMRTPRLTRAKRGKRRAKTTRGMTLRSVGSVIAFFKKHPEESQGSTAAQPLHCPTHTHRLANYAPRMHRPKLSTDTLRSVSRQHH